MKSKRLTNNFINYNKTLFQGFPGFIGKKGVIGLPGKEGIVGIIGGKGISGFSGDPVSFNSTTIL